MRQIRSEDKVSAEAVRGSGGRSSLPTVTPYIPNYKGVNQVLTEAPGSAEIGFMNSLAHMSSQYMAEQQELYDNMEVAEALSDVDTEYNQAADDFLKENQTGRGYTEFATGKYKELGDAALTNASNAKVKERLQQMFTVRRANIANSAFQKEKEMYTGYAMSQTELQLTRTLNEVADNPDQAFSLQAKLEQQLQPMKNILAAQEFEKYHREMMQQFVYFQGMGTIKKHPYQAEKLIQSEYYKSQLAPNKYLSLQKSAEQEREHQEHEAKIYQALQASALKQEEQRSYDNDFILPMVTEGKVLSEADIMAKNWSLHTKVKALKERQAFLKSVDEELQDAQNINNALEKDEFPEGLTQSKQEKFLTKLFNNTDNVNAGEDNYNLQTQTGQALFLKEHANTFQYRYDPLVRNVTTNIRYGKDEKQTMDACVALAAFHDIPALKGIPRDDVIFAMVAARAYAANGDYSGVQNLQKQFYQVTETDMKANEIRFKEIIRGGPGIGSEAERINDYIKNFYKEHGIELEKRKYLFWKDTSPDIQKVNTIAYDMIKRTFLRIGDRNLAEATTSQYLKSILKPDKDGILHINPPSTRNTNFKSESVLRSVSENALRASVTAAQNAGMGIQGTTRANEVVITNPNLIKEGKAGKRRKLYYQCEDPNLTRPIYSVYFLYDEDEPSSRQYLTDRFEGHVIVDFDILYKAREEARKDKELNNADNS